MPALESRGAQAEDRWLAQPVHGVGRARFEGAMLEDGIGEAG